MVPHARFPLVHLPHLLLRCSKSQKQSNPSERLAQMVHGHKQITRSSTSILPRKSYPDLPTDRSMPRRARSYTVFSLERFRACSTSTTPVDVMCPVLLL